MQRTTALVRHQVMGQERTIRRSTRILGAVLAFGGIAFASGAVAQRSLAGSVVEATPEGMPQAAARVAVYGDSLVVQAEPYLDRVAASLGLTVATRAHGGIALCDALPWIADDLRGSPPDLVVLAFSGNSLTDCMRSSDGSLASGDALVARYLADVETAIATVHDARIPLLLASPPASKDRPDGWHAIDALYREVAAGHAPAVQYVDAGIDIAPNGRFAPEQRCLPLELRHPVTRIECGDGQGTIDVRAGDGVHFCGDVAATTSGTCASYSSGALRYAIAIVTAAKLDLYHVQVEAWLADQPLG